jgi:hypothetical protein
MREAYEAKLQELTQGVQAARASADAARTQLNAAESKEKSGSAATQDAAAGLKAAFEQVRRCDRCVHRDIYFLVLFFCVWSP